MFLQPYAQRGKFKVYIVDGEKARKLDEQITDWATSGSSRAVPKNQIWLDREATDKEYPINMDEALAYQMGRDRGWGHDKAIAYANRKAEDERGCRYNSDAKRKPSSLAFTAKVEIKKIGRAPDGGDIMLVDGSKVRKLDPNFTEGGHDLVYHYIPKGPGGTAHYWMDNENEPKEMPYFVLHETVERALMAKGMKYDEAHKIASEKEHKQRMEG